MLLGPAYDIRREAILMLQDLPIQSEGTMDGEVGKVHGLLSLKE